MVLQPSCIFCQIISGKAEASIVYKDEIVTTFMDIQPLFQGHLLIVPNDHYIGLADLDDHYGRHMFVIARQLAHALRRSSLNCEGVNLFLADGSAAGQDVFHSHLHVIPRNAGDGFRIQHPAGYGDRPTRPALNDVAEQLRCALDNE